MNLDNTEKIIKELSAISDKKELAAKINGLNKEEYTNIDTLYTLGRAGKFDSTVYHEKPEVRDYIELKQSNNEEVTDKELDDKFLTSDMKRNEIIANKAVSLSSLDDTDGVYNHNYLANKSDFIVNLKKGVSLAKEI